MGFYILQKDNDGLYSFTLFTANKQELLTSEKYDSKDEAENGIETVRTIASFSSRFDQMRSTDDRHYFILKTANDHVIGTSKMYDTNSALERAIDDVMHCAALANVVDDSGN